jgi:hypothetical protein
MVVTNAMPDANTHPAGSLPGEPIITTPASPQQIAAYIAQQSLRVKQAKARHAQRSITNPILYRESRHTLKDHTR